MFGIHLKHVLVLTLLAGIAYTLPQVREGLSESFSSIYPVSVNEANVVNFEANTNIEEIQYVDLMPDPMQTLDN